MTQSNWWQQGLYEPLVLIGFEFSVNATLLRLAVRCRRLLPLAQTEVESQRRNSGERRTNPVGRGRTFPLAVFGEFELPTARANDHSVGCFPVENGRRAVRRTSVAGGSGGQQWSCHLSALCSRGVCRSSISCRQFTNGRF